MLGHLEQLKPTLERNTDVIAFMDLGFIGCWGEMHSSSNRLVEPGTRRINDATRAIVAKAMAVLPESRMIAVRYPVFKFEYFGSSDFKPTAPLEANEAYSGSVRARWGQHDDCLVCGEWNGGTFWSPRQNAPELLNFLEQDNRFVVQSGEPGDPCTGEGSCGGDEDGDGYVAGQHASCERMKTLLPKMCWSAMNVDYNPSDPESAVARWKRDGCFGEMGQKLGYRYRLLEGRFPVSAQLGSSLKLNFTLKNDGYAAAYNPRPVEINLQNTSSGQVYTLRLEGKRMANQDPHFWLPGSSYTVSVEGGLPSSAPAGTYKLGLVLPDPLPSLYNRPEYAIRLANAGVWDGSGVNDLGVTVKLSSSGTAAPYSGTQWFK